MKKILLVAAIVSSVLLLNNCTSAPCSSCRTLNEACCGSNSYTGNWY